ncbi:MAG: SDR family oxidoreductase [Clostridia bacterium]|nr:SDR family oxidoreductase [Clostridia bacterium]
MKNVLITGGAGGIGQGIVEKFIKEGYFVYVLDKDESALNQLSSKYEGKCSCHKVDVSDANCVNGFISSLPQEKTINYVITLAGRAGENEWLPFEEQTAKDVEDSIKVNLLGHINVIMGCLPLLKKASEDKAIVMVSSINALQSFGLPAYSASKSGLYGFMNGSMTEFGKMGIRINTVSPGTVLTEATKKEPKNFKDLLSNSALNKFATIKNVADVTFALCETFDAVTGEDIVVDCGQSKIR